MKVKRTEIIAELGINHNGDLNVCREMIDHLVEIGIDAVKFQIVSKELDYNLPLNSPLYPYFERSDLGVEGYARMAEYCKKQGVKPYSSIADVGSVSAFKDADFELVKLSSSNLTNRPLHEAVAMLGKPVIFSTGSGLIEEIINTCHFFERNSISVSVLHCIANYPAPFDQLNLNVIDYLKRTLGVPIGFSDHSEGSLAGAMAVQHGASILEKHFTLDHLMEGPDHKFSLTPEEMKSYVNSVRLAEEALGDEYHYFKDNSTHNQQIKRALVLTRSYKKGEIISENDLVVARPNEVLERTIHPFEYRKVLGRKTRKSINRWDALTWDSI